MNSIKVWTQLRVLLAGSVCLAFALSMNAQVRTETNTTAAQPSHDVTIERGEVAYVSGNELVVKMEDGTIRHFANVPESARVTVDGQELGIHSLKPGMKLERTTIVTTTPKTITTVKSVTRKSVAHLSAQYCNFDPGRRDQPGIQDPKGPKVHG